MCAPSALHGHKNGRPDGGQRGAYPRVRPPLAVAQVRLQPGALAAVRHGVEAEPGSRQPLRRFRISPPPCRAPHSLLKRVQYCTDSTVVQCYCVLYTEAPLNRVLNYCDTGLSKPPRWHAIVMASACLPGASPPCPTGCQAHSGPRSAGPFSSFIP